MESPGDTPPGQTDSLEKEMIILVEEQKVTLTVSVESVTVLQEIADLRVREEGEPVTQWIRLTALEAGILIEMI